VTLSDLSIQRPVLTWMLALALLTFGVLGYQRLGVDQFPAMEFPEVNVRATLEGATPESMEEDVTDVLEEYLSTISGVRRIRSTSAPGASLIEVEFQLGADLDVAIQDVRDQVAAARNQLPDELDPPTVGKFRASGWPVLYVPFLSPQRSLVEVSEYVRRQVKPVLETIPGVAGVQLYGRRDRTIRIWLDADALNSRGLAASDVIAALRREHVDVPGGLVEGESLEWKVETEGEFRSLAELEEMVVTQESFAPILLRDVARVEDGEEDVRFLVRYNGQPAVVAGITKQTDANTVSIVDEAYRRVDQLRPLLPAGVEVLDKEGFTDFSLPIRESVAETKFALLFGGLLAVLVVFVFLRRTRPTLIVAAAIPLSLIGTFGLVWIFGYTLNTMTLLGMTLAIGVVIDDAIIVLENIERHREGGKSARQAAFDGTRQITFAATAATFSVAAVFLPTAFAEGMVGNFLSEFGLTVAGSVVLSLFVALTLTPMLAARMPPPKPRAHGSIYQRLERSFSALEAGYRAVLAWTLRHRAATAAVALASFAAAIAFGARLPREFFPSADGRIVSTAVETPPGTALEVSAAIFERNEEYYLGLPERESIFEAIGLVGGGDRQGSNVGVIFMTLKPAHERKRTSQELIREAREVLGRIPGQKVSVSDPTGSFQSSTGFEVELLGNVSLRELDEHATAFMRQLERHGGFVDIDKNLKVGLPEVRVIPDRRKAASLGVDAASLGEVVQVMIGGLDVGVYKEGGHRYDIRMRLDRADRETPDAIRRLSVRGRDGKVVELGNLVSLETGASPSAIARSNRQRAVTVSSNLEGLALGEAVAYAQKVAAEILPEGVSLGLTGAAETMRESGEQFSLMLWLAILVIYMVLAAQFESFLLPLSVMLALPFAMVGALGGLALFGMSLNLFSTIGIVLLLGLVTKNSILLIDYAQQLRAEGMDTLPAILQAAPVRMRPVLMTALSMIFGVLPAAFGIGPGAETRAPMAVATGFGMLSSMLLTLLVVPLFYVFLDDAARFARALPARLRGRSARTPAQATSRPARGESARGEA
jgi:HAE1 family hydrophobic/amphiphilic exporter-1